MNWKLMQAQAENDIDKLIAAGESYGDSWKRRGGVGAFMMLARKWDRIEKQVERFAWDVFTAIEEDGRAEGIEDDIDDLIRYLKLVRTEMAEGEGLTVETEGPSDRVAMLADVVRAIGSMDISGFEVEFEEPTFAGGRAEREDPVDDLMAVVLGERSRIEAERVERDLLATGKASRPHPGGGTEEMEHPGHVHHAACEDAMAYHQRDAVELQERVLNLQRELQSVTDSAIETEAKRESAERLLAEARKSVRYELGKIDPGSGVVVAPPRQARILTLKALDMAIGEIVDEAFPDWDEEVEVAPV